MARDVFRALERHGIDALDLQRLHEALHHRVVVGVAAPRHRADQAMFAEQGTVGLGGVLRTSIRMVDASGWRVAAFDRRRQRRKSEPCVDPSADRVAHDAARPCIHDRSQVDEAAEDRDIGQIGDPELVRAIGLAFPGAVREDGLVVIAVGGGDEAASARRMQGVLAHQAFDLLVVHDPAPMPEGRLHAAPAIGLELILDRVHGLDQGGVVGKSLRCVVAGGARDPHQSASTGDGEAFGPVMTDMGALLGRRPCR